MGTLSGTVTIDGTEVSGAAVAIVDAADPTDPSTWTVVGSAVTDANGDWSVANLEHGMERYHAFVQYEDGGQMWHAESQPFLTIDATLDPTPAALSVSPVEPSIGPAIPDSDIAQFEDGNLHSSFGGDTGSFTVNDVSPTLTGSYSLKEYNDQSATQIHSISGLERYPKLDQRFSCYASSGSDGFPIMGWGSDGTLENFYGFGYSVGTGELFLARRDADTWTELTSRVSVSVSANTWYDLEVEWLSGGSITGRLFDVDQSTGERSGSAVATISGTDSTLTSDGVALATGTSNGVDHRWDNYRVLEDLS